MRLRTVAVGLAIGAVAVVAFAAPGPSPFDQTLKIHLSAIGGRDLPGLLATVADDVVLILPNGKLIEGKKAYTAFHEEFFADKGWSMAFHELHRVESADMALVFFEYTFTEKDGSHKNYLAMTFKRSGQKWLLAFDQNTKQP